MQEARGYIGNLGAAVSVSAVHLEAGEGCEALSGCVKRSSSWLRAKSEVCSWVRVKLARPPQPLESGRIEGTPRVPMERIPHGAVRLDAKPHVSRSRFAVVRRTTLALILHVCERM